MTYIEFLKRYENYDKFILYLVALGFNISEIARLSEVTRATVYQVIERNQEIVKEYAGVIPDLLDDIKVGLQDPGGLNDERNTNQGAAVAG